MTGTEWLEQTKELLVSIVLHMVLTRYQGVSDLNDRIGDALLALAEASESFCPPKGRDPEGYWFQYALNTVAVQIRQGAQRAKQWAHEGVSFSDLARTELDSDDEDWFLRDGEELAVIPFDVPDIPEPSKLGVKYLWSGDPEDPRLVLSSGAVVRPDEYVKLVMGDERRRRVARHVLGDIDSKSLESVLTRTIWQAVDVLQQGTSFLLEYPEDTLPIRVAEAYEPQYRDQAVSAQKGSLVFEAEEEHYEYRGSDGVYERPVEGLSRGRHAWPPELGHAFRRTVKAWRKLAAPQCSVARALWCADNVLEIAAGNALFDLRERIAELADDEIQEASWSRSVARVLQEALVGTFASGKSGWLFYSSDVLADALNEYFSVDEPWEPEDLNPSIYAQKAEAFKQMVETSEYWDSQKARITALVDGASPHAAMLAAKRAYAAG